MVMHRLKSAGYPLKLNPVVHMHANISLVHMQLLCATPTFTVNHLAAPLKRHFKCLNSRERYYGALYSNASNGETHLVQLCQAPLHGILGVGKQYL